MGVSNPNTRGGRPVSTMVSSQSTNREQVGGPAKAGLGRHIGMGQFAYGAIVNGASGHAAPAFAGPNYPRAFALHRVSSLYPISTTNQLGGVGRGILGMTRAPADGVNLVQRAEAAASVHAFNKLWPTRMTRGLVPPPLPPNPPVVAPGHGYPFGMNL